MRIHRVIVAGSIGFALLIFAAPAMMAASKIGGTVTVLGVWGGQEFHIFNQLVIPFEEETGIKVQFTGTRDLNTELNDRIAADNPPDLAAIPNPAKLAELAAQGKLVELSTVLDMAEMQAAYGPEWINLGSANHMFAGIFVKTTLKGLVWYRPQVLQSFGVKIPHTFKKLTKTSQTLADNGMTPWAIGIESGPASGWVGTDWLGAIFLRMHGPRKYIDWYTGKLPWTSPEMRQVWKAWGDIVGNSKMTFGGRQAVVSTNFDHAFAPLFQSPPQALFHFQAAFIQGFIQKQFPDLKPGEDFNFFGFPVIKRRYGKAIIVAGDLFSMLKRTPQSEAFLKYMASSTAQTVWARSALGISANRNVTLAAYPDPISKKAAQTLLAADSAVFGAGDMMPSQMGSAFWAACVRFVSNPDDLDKILADLEDVRKTAYPQVLAGAAPTSHE